MKETHTAKSHRRRQRKHKYPQGYQPWNKRVRVTPNGEQPDETDVSLRYFAQDGSGTELPADFETWTPAVAYIRESTEDLAERFGPAVQRAAIATYCRQHQIRIVDEFYDTDSGDIPLSSRPEGAALLKALKLQKAKAIVTLCLDRLARNEADAHATWKAFRYAQVDLHFARRGQQDDSIAGRMLFGIEATMAAVERELIRERTMKGRRRKLEENKWDGAAVAYGYVRAGRGAEATLVIDPETGPIVQRIFEWYVFGDQDGSPPLSMRAIAMRLRAMGVPRPGARYDGDTSNCQWVQAMVRRILRNSTYRGIYEHGKTIILPKEYDGQPYEERRAWRNPDEIIRVRLPDSVTLVSNAVWEAAQERMAHNREMKNRQRKNAHVYMLSGYIICPHCNRRLSGKTVFARSRPGQQADRYYYTCFDPEGACRSRSRKMPAEILDGLVLGLLQTELAEPRLSQNLSSCAPAAVTSPS